LRTRSLARQNRLVTQIRRPARLLPFLLVLAMCHSWFAVCNAQEPSVAGVTVGFSSVSAGETDRPYLGPGFGGSSLGGLLFMHRGIRDRVSIGGEASVAADITGRQQQRVVGGANNLTSRHHDMVFSGVFKVSVVSVEHAEVGALVGAGAAWRHTVRDGTFRSDQPPFVLSEIQQTLSDVVFAATFGFDGAIVFDQHTALVFTGRIHRLADDDRDAGGVVRRGVASRLNRFGGGARFSF
jgi:hypothetical protein